MCAAEGRSVSRLLSEFRFNASEQVGDTADGTTGGVIRAGPKSLLLWEIRLHSRLDRACRKAATLSLFGGLTIEVPLPRFRAASQL